MIQLTPLDQTVAGKELIQMGVDIGVEKGRDEGELIGKIQMLQRFLKRRLTPKKKLIGKNTGELKAMLKKLESELNI
ncbi:hypothetical protein QUF80_06395 [Desulfococcaceae bacterium HSG8]|nr:hypothetical protein [Desulfococcaceae bacterium HSG8]